MNPSNNEKCIYDNYEISKKDHSANIGNSEGEDYNSATSNEELEEKMENVYNQLLKKVVDLEAGIHKIEDRNRRVECEKAFETSLGRRIVITGLTYVVAAGFLNLISAENPYLAALVPTGGYVLSTLSVCKKVIHCWGKCFNAGADRRICFI